jgi:hypothetical protein
MKITATSQLMPNHVAGAPLSAQKAVAIAYTSDHSPFLFSLDEELSFAVTLPSATSGTGWEQIDLGAQLAGLDGLTTGSKVQAFAVSQDSDGTIWLVVAAAATATAPSKVFISTGLSNGSMAADFRSVSSHLSARQIPAGLVVSQAVVGSAGGDYPLAVIVADDTDGMMHHLQLNPDPDPGDWQSLPLQFATNTTRCRAVAVGVNDRYGAGVYAVCELATLVNMTFTTLPQMVSGRPVVRTVEMTLPDGLNPAAISAVAAANGSTELYAAGQGVYRWPVSAQVSSNQPGLPVASAASFAGVSELLAVEDAATGHISVWGQDQRDVLMQVAGVRSTADAVTWQAALPVASEVTAMAGYRVPAGAGTSTAGLLLGTTSGALNLTVQDPQSTLWQQQSVNLRRLEVAQTLNTYTTRVLVTDDDGRPSAATTVNIQPDTDCAVLINGAYYALKKAVAKPAVTDLNGVLTIVSETSDITAPVYTFSVAATAEDATTDGAMVGDVVTVSEDPGKEAKDILRGVRSGPDLAGAKRCNGDPLFPTPPDEDAAKAAATALSKVMGIHDALAAGQRPPLADRAASTGQPPRVLFAVHYRDGKSTLLDDVHATLAVPAAEQDWQLATPGDLLRALFGESEFTYWVDDAWNFCVQIGQEFLQFLVDVAEKAIGVVDWVLRKTLGLSLDDLISWLGFIFSWGDIRRNHTAIAKMVELTLDWSVTGLIDAQAQVRGGFDTIKKMINGGGGIHPGTSSPVLQDKTKTSPDQPAQAQSAEGNWGSQQLSANGQDARPANPALPTIEDLWSSLGEGEIEVMKRAYASLQDLIENHYQEYTYLELIEKFVEIVATAVVDAVESALITMLSAAALTATVIKALLSARWDIPVLTYVYEQIICQGDGSKLTLLDLLSLLAAIPATIGAKLVTQQNLFSDAQLTAITAATTMDQLVKGLTTAPYQLTADGVRLGADPALIAAATLEFIGMTSRGVSMVFFGLRELSSYDDTLKETFNTGKITADYVTYTMAMVSMLLMQVKSPTSSPRRTIDAVMTTVSGIAPARDCYVISFREEHGKEMAEILANGLRYVETACGLALAISACVSLGLQVNEPPPDIDRAAWDTILAMKFLQNFCSGAYYSLAFTQLSYLPKDSRYKASAVRMVILVIRWAANCTRSIMQLHYRVIDYDGPL